MCSSLAEPAAAVLPALRRSTPTVAAVVSIILAQDWRTPKFRALLITMSNERD
jgi:hypothetical protein